MTLSPTLPGSLIRWTVTPPQDQMFIVTLSTSNTEDTQGNPAFRGVLTDTRENLPATLTSLSEASVVEGTMVECVGSLGSQEGPLTIAVVNILTDPPSPPMNPRVSSTQNQPNSSIITLDWDSPSSGGMSSPSPQHLSPSHQSPWRQPLHRSLSYITFLTM